MSKLRALYLRTVGLFINDQNDADLRAEFESHLELHTNENIRRGMSPVDARRDALRATGGLTIARELVREQRSLPLLETIAADVRYALRSLKRNRAFTAVAVITLALGIGASSAIFSVVNAVVLRPLPYGNSEQLMTIVSTRNGQTHAVSVLDFLDWRRDAKQFTGLIAGYTSTTVLTGRGEPIRLSQARVSANAFEVLSIRPVLGRSFRAGEDEESAPRVAMIDEGVWRRRFGADSTLIGKSFSFDGYPTTIIGIAPAALRWPGAADIWMTTRFTERDKLASSRGARWLDIAGRVGPNVSINAASSEMHTIAARLAQLDPQHNTKIGARVSPLLASIVGDLERPLYILLGATTFVLLISCANVASLSLARVATRDSEFAVRTALGASRTRIIRQILTESLLVGIVGGSLGLLVAFGCIKALIAAAPAAIPRLDEISLDARVVAFGLLLTIVTAVLFGVAPAVQGSAINLQHRLRNAGRGMQSGKLSARSRRALVIAEVSLAIVLLAGAGLLLRSFALLQSVNPGFRAEGVSTFSVSLPSTGAYQNPEQLRGFESALLESVARTPGVQAVATSFALPLSGESMRLTFEIEGHPPAPADNEPYALTRTASEQYFTVMNIPLVRGRLFDGHDNENSRQVLVISNEVARRYFPGEDPIGKYLKTGWGMNQKKYGGEIIGVVGDVRQFALDSQPAPHVYMSSRQWPLDEYNVVVRSSSSPAVVFSAARAVLQQLDNQIPLNEPRTLSEIVGRSLGERKFYSALLSVFAAVAMMLALIGIYGIIVYSVQQREREIGIRLALGATRRGIVRMVLLEGMQLVIAGVVLGTLGTFALSRLLQTLLFQVGTRDPVALVVAPVLLLSAAAIACLLPARTAAQMNPVEAIRGE